MTNIRQMAPPKTQQSSNTHKISFQINFQKANKSLWLKKNNQNKTKDY